MNGAMEALVNDLARIDVENIDKNNRARNLIRKIEIYRIIKDTFASINFGENVVIDSNFKAYCFESIFNNTTNNLINELKQITKSQGKKTDSMQIISLVNKANEQFKKERNAGIIEKNDKEVEHRKLIMESFLKDNPSFIKERREKLYKLLSSDAPVEKIVSEYNKAVSEVGGIQK